MQIYFSCVKHQAKSDFLKHDESTEVDYISNHATEQWSTGRDEMSRDITKTRLSKYTENFTT